jgi:hypothetical protein
MRVTSALWVGAHIRRCFGQGAMASLLRHGADEAGAILVVVDRLDGTVDLYGPAPQSAFTETRPSDRLFHRLIEKAPRETVQKRIDSELRFDPDLWILEIEDKEGRAFLDLAGM